MNRANIHGPREQPIAGFTLLELLTSLAILTIIATFCVAGLNIVQRAWTQTRGDDAQSRIDAGLARLSEFVTKTEPAASLDPTRDIAALAFQGRRDGLSFVTLSEGYALNGGLVRASIEMAGEEQTASGDRPHYGLLLHTAIFRPVGSDGAPNDPVMLLDDVLAFNVRYFGSIEPRSKPGWYDQWLGKDQLPLLIAIDLDLLVKGNSRHIHLNIPVRHAP